MTSLTQEQLFSGVGFVDDNQVSWVLAKVNTINFAGGIHTFIDTIFIDRLRADTDPSLLYRLANYDFYPQIKESINHSTDGCFPSISDAQVVGMVQDVTMYHYILIRLDDITLLWGFISIQYNLQKHNVWLMNTSPAGGDGITGSGGWNIVQHPPALTPVNYIWNVCKGIGVQAYKGVCKLMILMVMELDKSFIRANLPNLPYMLNVKVASDKWKGAVLCYYASGFRFMQPVGLYQNSYQELQKAITGETLKSPAQMGCNPYDGNLYMIYKPSEGSSSGTGYGQKIIWDAGNGNMGEFDTNGGHVKFVPLTPHLLASLPKYSGGGKKKKTKIRNKRNRKSIKKKQKKTRKK